MSTPDTFEVVEDSDASVAELLVIAGDLVEWVGGRIEHLMIGRDSVGVHVSCQRDAEHLARILSLGVVTDFPPEDGSRGFTVWSSGPWAGPRFSVACAAAVLARPVRAFPPCEPWWLDCDDGLASVVA